MSNPVRIRSLRKKNFFEARKKIQKKNVATKLEGGGLRPYKPGN